MKAAQLFDLTGRVALVTGASSGLGERFARTLALNGAKVACLARRRDRLDALVAGIEADGGEAMACEADVTDAGGVARAFDRVQERFGPVTILVNNAGIAQTGRVLEQPPTEWRRVLDVNLDAVYAIAREAGLRMREAGQGGAILNVASILGFRVSRGLAAYAVAKAGVVQLTRAMALELAADAIRVNAVAPGYVVTEINREFLESRRGEALRQAVPLKRFGEPGDLDGVLLLLVSDAGRFITGATYVVDGGHMLAVAT